MDILLAIFGVRNKKISIRDHACRDESGTDIFRPYSRPNPFRGVLIRPYLSPDI
jgi:hypothetical protein